ncbi:hypothetical protein I7I50_00113 [Histoplasma capsulatum G186AR]|uniref:Uncharacterized protein n=1 Tax=Ajellomyces capsulatus TaxID=5037 RepID=A0A8H7YFW8_AJECA|nr:hypothetical protein I7I52_07382 [Histoplasma capsulatum]QSS72308.1 hypothetical protein I7I50_00113 [Histoplasma capsulatum G186AR]
MCIYLYWASVSHGLPTVSSAGFNFLKVFAWPWANTPSNPFVPLNISPTNGRIIDITTTDVFLAADIHISHIFPGACWVKPVQGCLPKHHRFTMPSSQLIPQPPFTKQNNAIDKFKRTPRSHRKT